MARALIRHGDNIGFADQARVSLFRPKQSPMRPPIQTSPTHITEFFLYHLGVNATIPPERYAFWLRGGTNGYYIYSSREHN